MLAITALKNGCLETFSGIEEGTTHAAGLCLTHVVTLCGRMPVMFPVAWPRPKAKASSPKADALDLDNATRQLEQLVEESSSFTDALACRR